MSAALFLLLGLWAMEVDNAGLTAENVIESKSVKFAIPQLNRYFCVAKRNDTTCNDPI